MSTTRTLGSFRCCASQAVSTRSSGRAYPDTAWALNRRAAKRAMGRFYPWPSSDVLFLYRNLLQQVRFLLRPVRLVEVVLRLQAVPIVTFFCPLGAIGLMAIILVVAIGVVVAVVFVGARQCLV